MLPEAISRSSTPATCRSRSPLPAEVPSAADRPDAVRHLHRRNALLSERHLLPVVGANGEARLRAVATDGHRLAKAELPAPEGAPACRA
jgi:hypothetical protein